MELVIVQAMFLNETAKEFGAHGKGFLPVRISHAVKSGALVTPFHTAEIFLNNVTSPYRDKYTLTPE